MTEPNETAKPSGASGGSDSYVPVWADDLGREIACYLWGISALRHGLTMPGDFIPCVSAALRAGFANGQIRLPPRPSSRWQAQHRRRRAYEYNDDDQTCAELEATLRGLLERLK